MSIKRLHANGLRQQNQYCNESRPRQGLAQRIPPEDSSATGKVITLPVAEESTTIIGVLHVKSTGG